MRIDMISEHASPLAALGGADAGGQNVHVAALAAALARRGHEVTVFTRRDCPTTPDVVPLAPGVTVEHVPAGPFRPLPKDDLPRYMPAFADWLAARWREQPPDVAHAHFWMSGLAALFNRDRRPADGDTVWSMLGAAAYLVASSMAEWLGSWTSAHETAISYLSSGLAALLAGGIPNIKKA